MVDVQVWRVRENPTWERSVLTLSNQDLKGMERALLEESLPGVEERLSAFASSVAGSLASGSATSSSVAVTHTANAVLVPVASAPVRSRLPQVPEHEDESSSKV